MRRALLALVSTVSGLVLLLSFKTQAAGPVARPVVAAAPVLPATAGGTTTSPPTVTVPEPTATEGTAAAAAPTAAATTAPAATTPAAAPAGKTVTGDAVDTRWGPVQVQITVVAGRVTAAVAVQYPTGNGRDQEINAYAVPTLEQETVQAGNAGIDMVSGATYTSTGYITSLQSALSRV